MQELISKINGSEILHAVSIIAAAITATYYTLKIVLRGGRLVWRRISPQLSAFAEAQSLRVVQSITLASEDMIYLVTIVVHRCCVTFLFYALYAVSLYDESNSASDTPWSDATEIAQFVFSAAGGWNLANLYVWISRVSRIRQGKVK